MTKAMKSMMVMVLFAGLHVSTSAADELLTLEQYADDAAWIADSRDGFVFTEAYSSGAMDLQLVANPLIDAANPSSKVLHLVDNWGAGQFYAIRDLAESVTAGGEVSLKYLDYNVTPGSLYGVDLFENGSIVARVWNQVWLNRLDIWTTSSGWTQGAGVETTGVWQELKFELSNNSVTFLNNGTVLGTLAVPEGTVFDAIAFGFKGGVAYKTDTYLDDISIVVPEPATMLLLGLGGVTVLIRKRR